MPGPCYDIRQFGAVGDGATLDTAAIQHAIDRCHAAGGGVVVAPPGRYCTGTLHLRSRVTLHLTAGAVLLGSARREDYNADDIFPENEVFTFEAVTGAHLVIAYEAEDVAITGQGTIDGNSAQFFAPLPPEQESGYPYVKYANYPIWEWRPGQMVFFCRCRNVAVRDVRLRNAPYWTLFLFGCQTVQVRGLRIDNPGNTANGDGIDVDCCQDVTISDCIICAGDDCITLRGHCRPLAEHARPCQNVTVTNCVLSSPCNDIRVGVVRDCTFSNIVVKESFGGINIVSWYSDATAHGATIENIAFSGLTMDTVIPIHMILGHGAAPPAAIRNISFSDLRASARQGCYLGGNPDLPLQDIRLNNVHLRIRDGWINPAFGDQVPEPYQIWGEYRGVPFGLFARHINGLEMTDCRITWEEIADGWRHALAVEHASDVTLRHLRVPPPPTGSAGEAVRMREVEGLITDTPVT